MTRGEIKPGDRVFVPMFLHSPERQSLSGVPIVSVVKSQWHVGVDGVDELRYSPQDVLPDSPQLPTVARWLAGQDEDVRSIISDILAKGVIYTPGFDHVKVEHVQVFVTKVAEALIKALGLVAEPLANHCPECGRMLQVIVADSDIIKGTYAVCQECRYITFPKGDFHADQETSAGSEEAEGSEEATQAGRPVP